MVADQWTAAQACVKAGAHCITLQAEGDIHLHHTLSWLGQQTVPVIGGEMPVIRGISLCPATPLDVIIPILSDVEVIQLLAVNLDTAVKCAPVICTSAWRSFSVYLVINAKVKLSLLMGR